MAITNVATKAAQAIANTQNPVVNMTPSTGAIATGDLILLSILTSTSTNFSSAGGFTVISEVDDSTASSAAVFWRLHDGSATYTMTSAFNSNETGSYAWTAWQSGLGVPNVRTFGTAVLDTASPYDSPAVSALTTDLIIAAFIAETTAAASGVAAASVTSHTGTERLDTANSTTSWHYHMEYTPVAAVSTQLRVTPTNATRLAQWTIALEELISAGPAYVGGGYYGMVKDAWERTKGGILVPRLWTPEPVI